MFGKSICCIFMLKNVWKFKYILIKIKFGIYNSNVKLVLFDGLEIWSFIISNRLKNLIFYK